ncbi:MAG: hypothetical protein HYV63_03190 [Candidatus Schekmanbacteria bacterium]|nr:hypothetical protein [Candidatus Schekmanbacteria bacterium]
MIAARSELTAYRAALIGFFAAAAVCAGGLVAQCRATEAAAQLAWTEADFATLQLSADMLRLWGRPIDISEDLDQRIEDLEAGLWEFDLPRLYDLLPAALDNGGRGGGILLTSAGQTLNATEITSQAALQQAIARLDEAGATLLWAELTRSSERVYHFAIDFRIGLGALGPRDLDRVYKLGLAWLHDPRIGKKMWSDLQEVPRLLDFIAAEVGPGQPQCTAAGCLTLQMRIDPELMRKHFPELSRYARKLGDLLESRVTISVDQKPLASSTVTSNDLTFKVDVAPLPNGLVPLSAPAAAPAAQEPPVDLLAARNIGFNGAFRVELFRLSALMDQVRWDIAMDRKGSSELGWRARPLLLPKITYDGYLLGFVPPWAIDLFIPSNLMEITREFTEVLFRGPPKPLNVDVSIMPIAAASGAAESGHHQWRVHFEGQAVHNGLMSFGLGRVRNRLRLNAAGLQEYHQLFKVLGDALAADVATLVTTTNRRITDAASSTGALPLGR